MIIDACHQSLIHAVYSVLTLLTHSLHSFIHSSALRPRLPQGRGICPLQKHCMAPDGHDVAKNTTSCFVSCSKKCAHLTAKRWPIHSHVKTRLHGWTICVLVVRASATRGHIHHVHSSVLQLHHRCIRFMQTCLLLNSTRS